MMLTAFANQTEAFLWTWTIGYKCIIQLHITYNCSGCINVCICVTRFVKKVARVRERLGLGLGIG